MLIIIGIGMILAGTLLSPVYTTVFTFGGILLYIGTARKSSSPGALVLTNTILPFRTSGSATPCNT